MKHYRVPYAILPKRSARNRSRSAGVLIQLTNYSKLALTKCENSVGNMNSFGNFQITKKRSRISTEHIDIKNSSDSKLQISPICSVRILSFLKVTGQKPSSQILGPSFHACSVQLRKRPVQLARSIKPMKSSRRLTAWTPQKKVG